MAHAEGIVQVHVPFSLQDLSQIEEHLGSFSADISTYISKCQYLSQTYDLIWHDISVVLSSILTPMSEPTSSRLSQPMISEKKLKQAEEGPQNPIQYLVKMAFKVYNVQEESAELAR